MIERGAESAEVRDEVFDEYNARLDLAMADLIWGAEGAGSYYVNEKGRASVNMPWTAEQYYSWMAEPDLRNFTLS